MPAHSSVMPAAAVASITPGTVVAWQLLQLCWLGMPASTEARQAQLAPPSAASDSAAAFSLRSEKAAPLLDDPLTSAER
jgi:hypothetical protein